MYNYDRYLVNEELRHVDTIIFKNIEESLLMKIYINTVEGTKKW